MEKNIDVQKIDPNAMHIMRVMNLGHFKETRLCGGCVRDLLANEFWKSHHKTPKDWDLATEATPEEVIKIWGDKVVATGMQHGTVSIILDHKAYEITTLRIDEKTDGRHAQVKWTSDWYKDSCRRDFTINAMYLDMFGQVHDYHNGINDVMEMSLNFVGDPKKRIEEDYLRILRSYRFEGRGYDATLQVTEARKKMYKGLSNISVERIWMEMKQIIQSWPAVTAMDFDHVLVYLMPEARLPQYKDMRIEYVDPAAIFAAFFETKEQAINQAQRWKMSNVEKKIIEHCFDTVNLFFTSASPDAFRFNQSKEDSFNAMAFAFLQKVIFEDIIRTQQFEEPIMLPVTGADFIKAGHKAGKEISILMKHAKNLFIESRFTATSESLIRNAFHRLQNNYDT